MSFNAQKLVRDLRRKVRLTPNTWRLLDYLALCANETEFQKQGTYYAFPSEDDILYALDFSSATLYRSLIQMEFGGLYLITRRNRTDARKAGYDLHILESDLTPEAIQERQQSAAARLSAAPDGNGVRKRNASPVGPDLPEITSQNERYSPVVPENYLSKCDVITSHFETETPEITSQNERHNKECIGTIRNLNLESSPDDAAGPPADDALRTNRKTYTTAVWATFSELPGAKPRRPSAREKALIGEWFDGGLPVVAITIAIWEGFGRRIKELGEAPTRVNSLEYFRAIVAEVGSQAQRFANSRTAAFVAARMRQQVLDACEQPKAKTARGRGG